MCVCVCVYTCTRMCLVRSVSLSVQASWGVRVPVKVCKSLWRCASGCVRWQGRETQGEVGSNKEGE